VLALEAGVDVLLIADDRLPDGRSAATVALEALAHALEQGRLSIAQIETALARVDALRARQRLAP
jgi:beta-glucosidase-like glycosyl hydrolase